jgi:hypothetical protein
MTALTVMTIFKKLTDTVLEKSGKSVDKLWEVRKMQPIFPDKTEFSGIQGVVAINATPHIKLLVCWVFRPC